MFLDIRAGLGPMYMRTEEAMQKLAGGDPARMEKVREEAWEDFLDMTISQALTWAAQNIAPEVRPSEVVLAEPYIMGSHSGEAGAWVSGPEDVAPPEYFWGYNKMTTLQGLFAAGDGVGQRRTSSRLAPSPKDAWRRNRRYAMCWTTPKPPDQSTVGRAAAGHLGAPGDL
jgi:succinate dehydrogenase/fumarate reductase flavoprotein subunit